MRKKMLFILIVLLSLLLVGCGKKEETIIEKDEEKIVEEEHKITIAALCGSKKVCFYDEDFNMLSSKEIGSNYNYDIYDYNLFYEKGNNIYKYNLETEKEEKLNINIVNEKNKSIIFKVEGNYLYYVFGFENDIYVINLKDGTESKIENEKYLVSFDVVDGKAYYINTVVEQKCLSCLVSSSIDNGVKVIEKQNYDSILDRKSYYLLYRNAYRIVLYNMKDDTATEINLDISKTNSTMLRIYNGNVYGIVSNNLVDLKNNDNIYEFKFEDGEEIKDYAFINKNKIIASIKSEEGFKLYIYDLENDSRKEYEGEHFYNSEHVAKLDFTYVE